MDPYDAMNESLGRAIAGGEKRYADSVKSASLHRSTPMPEHAQDDDGPAADVAQYLGGAFLFALLALAVYLAATGR